MSTAGIISQAAKLGAQGTPVYRLFSMEELEEATGRFDQSTVLGAGSIGKVGKHDLKQTIS